MKNTLMAIAVVLGVTACNSNPKPATVSTIDTTGNYQRYLADTARAIVSEGIEDTLITNSGATYVKVDPNATTNVALVPKAKAPVRTKSPRSGGNSGGGTVNTGSTTTAPVAAKKKGWSSAAKGTAIGAGTGAVAGAILSKKKGKGAIIGGVVGAAGGYIIGRQKDKKTGRAN